VPRTLLVAQAGGATTVINRTLAAIVSEATGKFDRIIGARRAAEGLLAEDFVDLGALSPSTLIEVARTPGAALQSSRYKLSDLDIEPALSILRAHHVDAFLYIGGNDSADTVHRIALAGGGGDPLHAIAVPKTIDNDLPETDHSPGYGSIARYIAVATMDSAKDTESMPGMYPIKFIEVMGRDAGWVAAASTLGRRSDLDAPQLIYVPERPLARDRLLADVEKVYRHIGHVVAVVSETVRDDHGNPFADPSQSGDVDAFGHPLLRGTAETMCRLVQAELGLRSRWDKPGSLQRMAMGQASSVDLAEADEVGREAVRLALRGVTDRMITLVREGNEPYVASISSAPLGAIANRQQLLPDHFLDDAGTGTTEAFRSYARPLLGPEPLPGYARIDAVWTHDAGYR